MGKTQDIPQTGGFMTTETNAQTPRTDAVFNGQCPWNEKAIRSWSDTAGHFIDLCRTIERELTAAESALAELRAKVTLHDGRVANAWIDDNETLMYDMPGKGLFIGNLRQPWDIVRETQARAESLQSRLDAAEMDSVRLDYVEQITSDGEAIDLCVNWTVNGKRHQAGIRSAIDAALSASAESEDKGGERG